MICAVCQRPLLQGVTACIMCGAPVGPPPQVGAAPVPQFDAYAAAPPMPMPMPQAGAPPAYGGATAPYGPPGPPYGAGQSYGAPYAAGQGYGAPMPVPVPQAMPAAGYGAYARDNGFAVASLVCGLFGLVPFWIGFILCILAIIFGVLGLQRANGESMGRGRGLAIAGIVLGMLFVLPASCGL